VGNPDHQEWNERRTPEKTLNLLHIESLRLHSGRLFWQVRYDSISLLFREELDGLRVIWKVEKGINRTKYGWNTFQDEELKLLALQSHQEYNATHPTPSRKPCNTVHKADCVCKQTANSTGEHTARIEERYAKW
jgi:hypothetical protein